MRNNNRKWNSWGRRITSLLLLCGLLLSVLVHTSAATVIYKYDWIKSTAGLPTDNQWHDYFIAWEDLDDSSKVWFTDYHWFTADGYNNYDAGGSHWMEYKAGSTLPDRSSSSFESRDCLGHMQIKYAGIDKDNDNSPMYMIRVSKMSGGYVYFTRYEPADKEADADAFTFQDKGDVFHIFVNISGKADRYLTRDGQDLETTESTSYGGGEHYRPLRVYQRTFTIDEAEQGDTQDAIGKVTLYEYHWVNTVDELMALANNRQWTDILLAWEHADNPGYSNRYRVWYTKEVWYDQGVPNYKNGSAGEGTINEFFYWSNECLGSDGYSSAYEESFILPSKVGHFQVRLADWDDENPVDGYTTEAGQEQPSPVFNFRFDIGRGRYVYIGNNGFYDDEEDVEDYTVQLRLGMRNEDDLYGSVWIINNMWGVDEMITRMGNSFGVSDWTTSDYWEYPFRIYSSNTVEYDAIVKSFTVGRGATYSIDRRLILDEGVTITVEDGGILTVDNQLLNNGRIVVKNGGTVVVNEGGYIMAYDAKKEGKITLDGGNLVIMDGAKVICDQNGGVLEAKNGASILNRGLLLVGDTLILNNNSYLKNESTAMLLLGGRITYMRGAIGAASFEDVKNNMVIEEFTYLCSNKSKLINKGIISAPKGGSILANPEADANTIHQDNGYVDVR